MTAKKKKAEVPDLETRFLTMMGYGHVPLDEFLTFLSAVPTVELRASYLRRFAESQRDRKSTLRVLAECLYLPNLTFDLPAGDPPYANANDHTTASKVLYKVIYQLPFYIKGNKEYVAQTMKREQLFIQTLECLSAGEAKLLIMMKDKSLKGYNGVTEEVFRAAYPTWLPEKKPGPLN